MAGGAAVTTREERERAIVEAGELLEALAGYMLWKGAMNLKPVSRQTREIARRILRHYPPPSVASELEVAPHKAFSATAED